ncbi:MAG: NTP transferase domain-containing protein [Methylococcales bacterium]
MKSIWTLDEVFDEVAGSGTPRNWTAVIPAAGKGSRLGHPLPKILFPILDRPIAAWIIEGLSEQVHRHVFVLAPEGVDAVEPCLKQELGGNFDIVVQPEPKGMADAIFRARKLVRTPFVLVVWGDQVTLSPRTVDACIRLHEYRGNASLTFPSILKRDPYIHIQRGKDERITGVLETREKPIPYPVGENDCGLFLFSTEILFEILDEALSGRADAGFSTGEINLLPLIPRFDCEPGSVATVRIESEEETLGVNTQADVLRVSEVLARRVSFSR